MAVTVDELVLKITLSNEKTANQISKINDELKELKVNSARTASGVTDLGASFTKLSVIGFAAVKAVQATIKSVENIAKSFFDASDAVTRLNQALEISGSKNITDTSNMFQDLADAIENLGVADADNVLSLAKLGIAAGHSAEKVSELVKVSADLAIAKEIPIEAAFKALSSSLKGSAGALASFLPELKDMTIESAKAGDAVKYVGSITGGYAARNLETFGGQLNALRLISGKIPEAFGRIIDSIIDLSKTTNTTISMIQRLDDWLKKNEETIVSIGKTIKSYLVDIWPFVVAAVKTFIGVFQTAIALTARSVGSLATIFNGITGSNNKFGDDAIAFADSIHDMAIANVTAFGDMEFAATDLSAPLEDIAKKTDKNTEATKKFNLEIKSKEAEEAYKKNIEFLDKYYDALAQVAKQNVDLQAQFNKGSGMNVQDQIASNLAAQTAEIDAQIEKYKQAYGVNTKIVADLEKQKKLLAGIAAQQAKEAPSEQYQALENAGKEVADQITGVFTKGSMSIVGGAMSAVGLVVKAIDALLDFFPNFINSIAGVFNKLTDLPATMFKAFQGLFDGVIRFVKDFIPKLIESIPASLLQITEFIDGVVQAFGELLQNLPSLIRDTIAKLPEIVTNLVSSLTAQLPEMMISLIDFIIQDLPRIAMRIIEMMATRLPIAIMNGVIKGFERIAKRIKDLISGKGFKLEAPKMDTKPLDDAAKKLSENSARIFKVEDLLEAAKNPLKKVQDDIIGSFQKGRDYLKEAWNWVKDKIIPLIVDSILMPFKLTWEAIKFAFDLIVTVVRALWDALVTIVQAAWSFVQLLWDTLKTVVETAWAFVQKLWDTLVTVVQTAWAFVQTLWDALAGIVKTAWSFVENLWTALEGTVKTAFKFVDDLWNGLKEIVSTAFSFVTDLWDRFSGIVTGAFQWVDKHIIQPIRWVIVDAFKWVDEQIIKPIFGIITSAWNWVNDEIIEPIMWVIVDAWKWVNDVIIQPMFWTIIDAFKWVDKHILQPFKDALQFKVGGTNGGDILQGVFGALNPAGFLAKGGPVYASEGFFTPKGTDTVPAMLTPGEFVMSRPAVQQIGLDNLRAMNSGRSVSGGGDSYQVSIEINIDAKTTMDEGYIRGTLVPRMSEELKRASLDGKFVLSAKGIR